MSEYPEGLAVFLENIKDGIEKIENFKPVPEKVSEALADLEERVKSLENRMDNMCERQYTGQEIEYL